MKAGLTPIARPAAKSRSHRPDLTLRTCWKAPARAHRHRCARRIDHSTPLQSPGALALAWTRGVRKPYVAPFQLFLIADVILFALQSLTGINVFSSPLSSHLHQQEGSDLAQTLLAERLQTKGEDFEHYAPVFGAPIPVPGEMSTVRRGKLVSRAGLP